MISSVHQKAKQGFATEYRKTLRNLFWIQRADPFDSLCSLSLPQTLIKNCICNQRLLPPEDSNSVRNQAYLSLCREERNSFSWKSHETVSFYSVVNPWRWDGRLKSCLLFAARTRFKKSFPFKWNHSCVLWLSIPMWVLSNTSCRVQSHRIRSGQSTSGDLFTSNSSNAVTLSWHHTCGFAGLKLGVGAYVRRFPACVLLSKKLADGRRPETAATFSPRLSVIRRPPRTAQSFGGVLDWKVSSWMKRWVLVNNCGILEKCFLVFKDFFS